MTDDIPLVGWILILFFFHHWKVFLTCSPISFLISANWIFELLIQWAEEWSGWSRTFKWEQMDGLGDRPQVRELILQYIYWFCLVYLIAISGKKKVDYSLNHLVVIVLIFLSLLPAHCVLSLSPKLGLYVVTQCQQQLNTVREAISDPKRAMKVL